MKFHISATSAYRNYKELITAYPCLQNFGFAIEEETVVRTVRILDENRKPIWQEKREIEPRAYVVIDTLEQLIELMQVTDQALVIGKEYPIENNVPYEIEIYDGYRE